MGPLEFYIIRQTLLTVERVDKLKNVEWYKPVYICAFAGYAKITSSAQKVYTDMLFLALILGIMHFSLRSFHGKVIDTDGHDLAFTLVVDTTRE